MTLEALASECDRVEQLRRDAGLDPATASLVLAVPFKREPRNYDRVRVVPGLYGRCVGWSGEGTKYVVDIPVVSIRRYLKKQRSGT